MANKYTREDVAAITTKIQAKYCRISFEHFCKEFWETIPGASKLKWNWHMTVLCNAMQAVAERLFKEEPAEDLLINISPGTSKSSICSILFHPWTWTRMPNAKHINASHAEALVHDLANKSREVIKSAKYRQYFPEIEIRPDQDAKGYFANYQGGIRFAATVGGRSPIGFHGHFLLGDDLIDPEKVLSDVERETAKNFVINGLSSRTDDKLTTAMIWVMQRLGRGDPSEVVLDVAKRAGSRKVNHICLPAELTDKVNPPELAQHYVDNLMDPVRLPKSVLIQNEVKDPLRYAAQFLQDPRALGGGLFKEEYFRKLVPAAPFRCNRIRYWDRACLLGNSLIETEKGLQQIQDISTDDKVMTRAGLRRVKKSWLTKHVEELLLLITSTGNILALTPDHLIWTNTRGWVEAQYLKPDDELIYRGDEGCILKALTDQVPKRFDLEVYLSKEESTHLQNTISVISDLNPLKDCDSPRKSSYTEMSGSITTVQFPLAMVSVSKTETLLTAESKTLASGSWKVLTTVSEKWRAKQRLMQQFLSNFLKSHVTNFLAKPTSYRVNFKLNLITILLQVMDDLREYGCIPVYDLSVDKEREFLSNSILVHNSTADGGCYTAGVLMARDNEEGSFYVEDVVRGQWEPIERNRIMRETAYKDRARFGPNHEPIIYVEAEGGSSGRDAWLGIVRALAGFVIKEDSVVGMGSKDVRAELWSAQLAAGNVFLVEADWNMAYIDEHCLFKPEPGKRLGKYKDQVDSSSRACALLSQKASITPVFRTFSVGKRKQGMKILVCSREDLPAVLVEDRPSLLLYFTNPMPLPEDKAIIPAHSLGRLLDATVIRFADIDPADYQTVWNQPVEEYQALPEEIILNRDTGKQLWNFLLKQRPEHPGLIVLCDDGKADTRAYSVACGMCEALRLPKESTIYVYNDATSRQDKNPEPTNKHIYSMIRKTREMVVG